MQTQFERKITELTASHSSAIWEGIHRGIEREALRVLENGTLAPTDHPEALGKTLTHDTITTDYSENLLEFITPVAESIRTTLSQLKDIHTHTFKALGDELLWPLSMPCYIGSDKDIRVAKFGESHSGRMKSLYRVGLTHRYGATMQIISGVHFNFSVPETLWAALAQDEGTEDNAAFRSEKYFALIRNYKRLSWVIPFLFGASPALCESFFTQTQTENKLTEWDFAKLGKGTCYLPYGTSLRMSDLGYTNKEQASLKITYNNLDDYVEGLRRAITTPSENFKSIGVKDNGEYHQLNSNILQIENEFYSPIRPKRTAKDGETPTQALERGGVEYIEVRALDVNPFSEVGITAQQIQFLDLFLLYCLLTESAPMDWETQQKTDQNFNKAVMQGRNPSLSLWQDGHDRLMTDWLEELFAELAALARIMDDSPHSESGYVAAVEALYPCVLNPELTLSGQVLEILRSNDWDASRLGKELALKYKRLFREAEYEAFSEDDFKRWKAASEDDFVARKASDNVVDFDTFLSNYFEKAKCSGQPTR
ncbi:MULTISPECIES: glutamate--cysteine ligase [unclassified Idiomarina]|uniref:glutamate--cysteine ligase n=1 Tax=unclassified Idiomarina TaxID=2614829 RepID=UPI000C9254BD|nr:MULTISPECIES: glutamate--cysteine ligase [unclassified Idiomarina]MAD52919.1 glutamate--cysteine ligase [Idiomarinaceae bacterium]MEC7642202.1 glutamate--cysteine ligase [Pseudomonadota bacterium]NQZ04170.1 glutamate--cysteine ligase [Idiomarina sp.]